jgi:hypothetical protein
MRVWQHYREHMFRLRFVRHVESGDIKAEDAATFSKWVGMTGHPTFSIYLMARSGQLDHLANDEGFKATMRVLDAMGLGTIEFDNNSAQPQDEQFWEAFDGLFGLNEAEMKREIPNIITDPSNQAKVNALLAGRPESSKAAEQAIRLA